MKAAFSVTHVTAPKSRVIWLV